MYACGFELNDQPMSVFKIGSTEYPAFSGLEDSVNKRSAACLANVGPIPPGTYYIVDRESGGLLGAIRDRANGRAEWFAL